MGFRTESDVIVLLDGLAEAREVTLLHSSALEFSPSEYAKTVAGIVSGEPPMMDLLAEKRLIDLLVTLAAGGAIRSAHDISDGGLAVTLAECCFASEGLFAAVALDSEEPAEAALFGERGARAVVSVSAAALAHVLQTARQYGVAAQEIGRVTRGGEFRIGLNGRLAIRAGVEPLRDAWANSLQRAVAWKN